MKGISVAAKREWNVILDRYQMNTDGCTNIHLESILLLK